MTKYSVEHDKAALPIILIGQRAQVSILTDMSTVLPGHLYGRSTITENNQQNAWP